MDRRLSCLFLKAIASSHECPNHNSYNLCQSSEGVKTSSCCHSVSVAWKEHDPWTLWNVSLSYQLSDSGPALLQFGCGVFPKAHVM